MARLTDLPPVKVRRYAKLDQSRPHQLQEDWTGADERLIAIAGLFLVPGVRLPPTG
jgi:hypothetical protein